MAITVVGTGGNASANGGNLSANMPAGVQAGDVVYLAIFAPYTTTTLSPSTAGYNLVGSSLDNGTVRLRLFKKVLTGADANAQVTGDGNAANSAAMCFTVYRGVNTSVQEDVTPTTATGSSTNPNPAAITPITKGCAIFAVAGSAVNDATVGSITSYTNQTPQATASDTGTSASISGMTRILTTPGQTADDPGAYSSWSTAAWCAFTVAIRPAEVALSDYRGTRSDTTDKTQNQTWSFTNVDMGPDHAKRQVVICVGAGGAVNSGVSATLGGVAMTEGARLFGCAIFYMDTTAAGVTGQHATLVVTQTAAVTATNCVISIYCVNSNPTPTSSDTDGQGTTVNLSLTPLIATNGGYIIYCAHALSVTAVTATTTWDGTGSVVEDTDAAVEANSSWSSGHIAPTASATGRTIDIAEGTTSTRRGAAITFGIATTDISNDATLQWNMSAYVQQSADLRWNISAYVSGDADLRWNMSSYIANNVTFQWDIISTVPVSNDLEAQWNLIAYVQQSATLQWDISAYVQQSADLRWDMAAYIQNSLTVQWDMSAYVQQSATLQWNMSSYIANNVEVQWDIISFVISDAASATLQWNINNYVEQSATLQWNISAYVQQSATLQWNMSAYVAESLELQWDMSGMVNGDLTLQWDMAGNIGNSLTVQWNVQEFVQSSAELDWNISNYVQQSATLQWDMSSYVAENLTLQWDMSGSVTSSFTAQWDVRNLVANDGELQWNMSAWVANSDDLRWNITGNVLNSITLQWRIGEIDYPPGNIALNMNTSLAALGTTDNAPTINLDAATVSVDSETATLLVVGSNTTIVLNTET